VGTGGTRLDGTEMISDWDFVIITKNDIYQEDIHLGYGNIDVALYDFRTFESLVLENTIWVLECIFAPSSSIYKEDFNFRRIFQVDLTRLRRSVSFETSRQWMKSKRRGRYGNMYACAKCIFIAIRFMHYGTEIAQYGYIKNFQGVNHIWA
jgi:hypothetical protein